MTRFPHPGDDARDGTALGAAVSAPPETLRALTLWQPIASLAVGTIGVETRTWRTSPGPVAIHAAKSRKGLPWAELPEYRPVMARHGLVARDLPLGAVLAVADISDVRATDDWTPEPTSEEFLLGDYEPGRFCFILRDVRLLPRPVPVNGGRCIWRLPAEADRAVREQLTSHVGQPTRPVDAQHRAEQCQGGAHGGHGSPPSFRRLRGDPTPLGSGVAPATKANEKGRG